MLAVSHRSAIEGELVALFDEASVDSIMGRNLGSIFRFDVDNSWDFSICTDTYMERPSSCSRGFADRKTSFLLEGDSRDILSSPHFSE